MALLLKYGSDINAVNGCGVSALWLVAARGDLKGAQTLLRAGAGFEVPHISALLLFVTIVTRFTRRFAMLWRSATLTVVLTASGVLG